MTLETNKLDRFLLAYSRSTDEVTLTLAFEWMKNFCNFMIIDKLAIKSLLKRHYDTCDK